MDREDDRNSINLFATDTWPQAIKLNKIYSLYGSHILYTAI